MSDLTVLNTPRLTDEGIEKYWFDNNPSLTHFMSAVSVLFPEGERYFMKSMNHYRNQLSQETIKELNLFCKQEINHGRLHETLNKKLESLTSSMLLSKLENRTGKALNLASKFLSKKQQLCVTVCLEHITGIMGDQLLRRKDITDLMAGDIKDCYIYHGTEELDHCNVSFDIYEEVNGSHLTRRILMVPVTIGLIYIVVDNWFKIMYNDKGLSGFKGLHKSINILIGKQGFITGFIDEYLKWFKEDYHPMQLKNNFHNWQLQNKNG